MIGQPLAIIQSKGLSNMKSEISLATILGSLRAEISTFDRALAPGQ